MDNEKEMMLLSLLKSGNEQAFVQVYDLYKKQLFSSLLKLLKNNDLVEDVLQNLFVKIWESRENIDPERSLKAYLHKIATNMVIDYYRKSALDKKIQRKILDASVSYYNHIEERLFLAENREMLNRLIQVLPPKRRKVFELKYLDELSYEEIAGIMNIGHATINDHLLKAKKTLQQFLKENPLLCVLLFVSFQL